MKRLNAIMSATHGWLERIAEKGAPYVERILGRLPSKEEVEVVDFATDADLAMLRQEPLRARVLLRSIGIVFAVFIMWAAVAQLDEVTRGEGKVIPSRQIQVLWAAITLRRSLNCCSEEKSIALVGSSSKRIGGSIRKARAIATPCR